MILEIVFFVLTILLIEIFFISSYQDKSYKNTYKKFWETKIMCLMIVSLCSGVFYTILRFAFDSGFIGEVLKNWFYVIGIILFFVSNYAIAKYLDYKEKQKKKKKRKK